MAEAEKQQQAARSSSEADNSAKSQTARESFLGLTLPDILSKPLFCTVKHAVSGCFSSLSSAMSELFEDLNLPEGAGGQSIQALRAAVSDFQDRTEKIKSEPTCRSFATAAFGNLSSFVEDVSGVMEKAGVLNPQEKKKLLDGEMERDELVEKIKEFAEKVAWDQPLTAEQVKQLGEIVGKFKETRELLKRAENTYHRKLLESGAEALKTRQLERLQQQVMKRAEILIDYDQRFVGLEGILLSSQPNEPNARVVKEFHKLAREYGRSLSKEDRVEKLLDKLAAKPELEEFLDSISAARETFKQSKQNLIDRYSKAMDDLKQVYNTVAATVRKVASTLAQTLEAALVPMFSFYNEAKSSFAVGILYFLSLVADVGKNLGLIAPAENNICVREEEKTNLQAFLNSENKIPSSEEIIHDTGPVAVAKRSDKEKQQNMFERLVQYLGPGNKISAKALVRPLTTGEILNLMTSLYISSEKDLSELKNQYVA